jgi:hypothetical protein
MTATAYCARCDSEVCRCGSTADLGFLALGQHADNGSPQGGERAEPRPTAASPIEREEPFEILTTKQICELPDPQRDAEVLGPLLVRGTRVVVGAHTGHGKTTFALQLARAVGHGERFLKWTGAGARVLVIDAEQGLRTIKRRLTETGLASSEAVDYLRVPDGLTLDKDEHEASAVERVLAEGKYGVVDLDPFYKTHGGDSNDERAAVNLMRLFDRWREEHGFCLLLPVHCRKPPVGVRFSMHEFFGSSAYLRGAEVVLGLQLLRPGYSRLHFFKDRDGDLPLGEAWGLLFDREGGFRRDPNDGKPKETAADRVRELLEVDPGMTISALANATGYARRTVERALKDLGAREKSGPDNLKQWTLPLDGDAT